MTDDPSTTDAPPSEAQSLAAEIKRFRTAAGLTQRELALRSGYSREYVVKAERPGNIPSRDLVRALDSALNAGGALMARRARAKTEQRSLRTRLRTDSNADEQSAEGVPTFNVEKRFNPHGDSGTSPRLEHDVTAVRAMVSAFQIADRQVGGGVLYAQVLRYLTTEIAPRLVNGHGAAGAALFAAACSLTEIAGWMAHDSGDDNAARNHFDRAYRLASAADNAPLAGNVCASMAHLAGQLNQHADTVRIAEVGLNRVSSSPGTTRLTARLHTMRARGLAAQGERHACGAALAEAEHTLDTVGDEEPAEWIAGFDQASLASEAALCLRQLGDLAAAEKQARTVVRLRVGDRVRSRAFGQLTLAGVLADAGRVDEAATLGTEVCEVAGRLTSARVRSQLERLGAALRPQAAVAEVSAFLDVLHASTPRSAEPNTRWPV